MMSYFNNKILFAQTRLRRAFTLIEVALALTILAAITSSVLVVMSRCIKTTIGTQTKMRAFEIARENMEKLLASASIEDMAEFGISEIYPDIMWETIVETFYEPITSRMWVQAVCSATYTDSNNEVQQVELAHWLTNLSKKQVKDVLDQRKREQEFLEELIADEEFNYTPAGLWEKAEYFISIGEYNAAMDVLDEIMIEFPDSPEAEDAPVKQKLLEASQANNPWGAMSGSDLPNYRPKGNQILPGDFDSKPGQQDYEGGQQPDSPGLDAGLPFGMTQEQWDLMTPEEQKWLKDYLAATKK